MATNPKEDCKDSQVSRTLVSSYVSFFPNVVFSENANNSLFVEDGQIHARCWIRAWILATTYVTGMGMEMSPIYTQQRLQPEATTADLLSFIIARPFHLVFSDCFQQIYNMGRKRAWDEDRTRLGF